MRRRIFDIRKPIEVGLAERGATRQAESAPYEYEWRIETNAGALFISPYERWVACCFEDVMRAAKVIGSGNLNRFSGKWNWYLDSSDDVADFLAQLDHYVVRTTTHQCVAATPSAVLA